MRRIVTVVVSLAVLMGAPAASAQFTAKTSAQKQTAITNALVDLMGYAETYYCGSSPDVGDHDNCDHANSAPGFDMVNSTGTNEAIPFYAAWWTTGAGGVTQMRGLSALAYSYATLLEASAASTFVLPGDDLTRTQVEDRIEDMIKFVVYSNDLHDPDTSEAGDEYWGGEACWDAHCTDVVITSQIGMAAQLQWANLSSTTKSAVRSVVASEASLVADRSPGTMSVGNSWGEENGWGAATLAMAASFFGSDDPHPGASEPDDPFINWPMAAQKYAINSATIADDETDSTDIDGFPLSQWFSGANLQDDLTLINHGFFHPVYSWSALTDVQQASLFYDMGSLSQPDAFDFRQEEIWDALMGPLSWDDGDLPGPAGTDWTTHDYGHVAYLAGMATIMQKADASVLEWRAEEQFIKRINVAMDDQALGYAADMFRQLSQAWWMHEQFGSAPVPTEGQFDTARALTDGVHLYPDQDAIVGRFGEAFLSMYWGYHSGDTSPTALVIPSNEDFLSDPVLMQPGASTGVDSTSAAASAWDYDLRADASPDGYEDYFSTAGTIVQSGPDRYFSMTGFDDGTALLLDEGSGGTFSFGFEDLDGFVPNRTVRSDSGVGTLGDLSGNWLNVDHRFGLIAQGGDGLWADHVAAENPYLWVRGAKSGSADERVAYVMPNVTSTVTDNLEPDVKRLTSSSSSWEAASAVAPDGTNRIAVARWGGSGSSTISGLSSTLGVPIPDRPNAVTVTGTSGSTSFTLGSPYSVGHKGYWYVTTTGNTVTVTPIAGDRIKIVTGGSSTSVTVRYDAGPGANSTDTLTVPANTTAIATLYNGAPQIVLVTATSTEAPGTYAPWLAFDGLTTGTGNHWVSDGVTLSTTPQCLIIDLGSSINIGRLTMVPRTGYGPKDYKAQTADSIGTCGSDTGWTTRATVTSSGDGTTKVHTWTPDTDRYVRIKITAAYGSGPPHFVQVRELTPAPS